MTPRITYYRNAKWPWLDRDAPPVPAGQQPREGVEYGCGRADCGDCYEKEKTAHENRHLSSDH